jgi:fructose/tagatose bisphosphate aldolase
MSEQADPPAQMLAQAIESGVCIYNVNTEVLCTHSEASKKLFQDARKSGADQDFQILY